jgi:glycosyltransferase involved in cell wall biosynthesis
VQEQKRDSCNVRNEMETAVNLIIGVTSTHYSVQRFVTSLPYSHSAVVQTYDVLRVLSFLRRSLSVPPKATSFLTTAYFRPGSPPCDLLHLVNSISFSRRPWVASFEHYLPRWNSASRRGLQRLADDSCKRIIAWSRFAFREQEAVLERVPDLRDAIRAKMTILHPPQIPLISDYAQKQLPNDVISLAFIGRDFFRKGGLEMLRAFKRIRDRHRHIRLTVVSNFDYGDYASKSTDSEVREARQLCAAMHDAVTVHAALPNHDVLELLSRSHAALLPTYDDTYGFSVLEAQGAGCPVISTDVGTLPEINNDSVGWVVRVPRNEMGIAHRATLQQRGVLSRVIEDGVHAALEEIAAEPEVVMAKGRRALDRIVSDHAPTSTARTLEEIYVEALR